MLVVIRAGFAGQYIVQLLILFPLHKLLKGSLVVEIVRPSGRHITEDEPVDDALGRLKAAVHIRRGNDRLHRIRDDAGAFSAAALCLAVAKQQKISQPDGVRLLGKIRLADEVSADARQLSLRSGGEAPVEIVRHDEAQNGIAQKFQPFIVTDAAVTVLIGIGAVGQRVCQKGLVVKDIPKSFFQFTQHVPAPLAPSSCRHSAGCPR